MPVDLSLPTRTKVLADRALAPCVEFLRWGKHGADEPALLFEAGKVAVFDDFPAPACDLAWLRRVSVQPADCQRRIKKAKMHDMLAAPCAAHVLANLVPEHKVPYFRTQVEVGCQALNAAFKRLFPRYRPTGEESHSWRLAESFPEGLHCDSYDGRSDAHTRVRLFYNYDDVPRVWAIGPSAADLVRRWRAHLPVKMLSTHPNEVNAYMAQHGAWHEAPRHYVFFAPGTLWACDSQLVAHEIFYGRRAWAHTYVVATDSLLDPAASFQARVRAAVAEVLPNA